MISHILDKVVAIGHLRRVREGLAHGFSKRSGSISTDHLNFGMASKPG
jgi:hypothetical protein